MLTIFFFLSLKSLQVSGSLLIKLTFSMGSRMLVLFLPSVITHLIGVLLEEEMHECIRPYQAE